MNTTLGAHASTCRRERVPATRVLYTPGVLTRGVEYASRIRNLNLRRHCRDLAQAVRITTSMPDICRRLIPLVEGRSGILTGIHPQTLPVIPALLRIAAYSDYFIRPLDDWQPPPGAAHEQWDDLIRYLFDLWPVPAAFAGAWLVPGPLLQRSRDWYIHLARGGSMRHLPGMPPLRRSALAALRGAPACPDAMLAVRRAQLDSMRCPPDVVLHIMQGRMARDFANDHLWLPLIEKFCATESVDPRLFGVIADGLQNLVGEAGNNRAQQLLRLPLAELSRYWLNHWRHLAETLNPVNLPVEGADVHDIAVRRMIERSVKFRWTPVDGITPWQSTAFGALCGPCCWTVREMLSIDDLIREGMIMHHCVGGYSAKCMRRQSAIFSLTCTTRSDDELERAMSCTIELALPSRRIVQVQARWNRRPHYCTEPVIQQWAAENGVKA